MDSDDFGDYMRSFLFLRYLSDDYETAVKKELGQDYPTTDGETRTVPLALWYEKNEEDLPAFEKQMRRKVHSVHSPFSILHYPFVLTSSAGEPNISQ